MSPIGYGSVMRTGEVRDGDDAVVVTGVGGTGLNLDPAQCRRTRSLESTHTGRIRY